MASSVSNNGSGYVNYQAPISTPRGSTKLAPAAQVAKYDKRPFILATLTIQMPQELIDLSSYANEILMGLYGREA